MMEPVSPSGQYLNSSALSISVICILEIENHIDDSSSIQLINEVFLPINPRFSCIMVEDNNGHKHWKQVEVKVEDHLKVPCFPNGLSLESYNDYFDKYLSDIAMDPFPQARPLWEIHVIKYPTSNASGSIIFRLHHALGDGYSLMGALLSCLKRADNPSIPLTFPHFKKSSKSNNHIKKVISLVPRVFSGMLYTVLDFGLGFLRSTLLKDFRTPIRSGEEGVEFHPINITTITFSLDKIKQIKANLNVTINDVVTGVIFLGTRLYMESKSSKTGNARSTSLVMFNTRSIGGYKSVDDMLHNPEAQKLWGNQFTFLHVSIPKLRRSHHSLNPLKFVYNAHATIKRKRNSWATYATGRLLEIIRKYRGAKVTSKYLHRTMKNSSMTVTNVVGPTEKMTLSNNVVKGFYFMVVNIPQAYMVTIVSYMNELRITLGTEKGVIDPMKITGCINEAYEMILKASLNS